MDKIFTIGITAEGYLSVRVYENGRELEAVTVDPRACGIVIRDGYIDSRNCTEEKLNALQKVLFEKFKNGFLSLGIGEGI